MWFQHEGEAAGSGGKQKVASADPTCSARFCPRAAWLGIADSFAITATFADSVCGAAAESVHLQQGQWDMGVFGRLTDPST